MAFPYLAKEASRNSLRGRVPGDQQATHAPQLCAHISGYEISAVRWLEVLKLQTMLSNDGIVLFFKQYVGCNVTCGNVFLLPLHTNITTNYIPTYTFNEDRRENYAAEPTRLTWLTSKTH